MNLVNSIWVKSGCFIIVFFIFFLKGFSTMLIISFCGSWSPIYKIGEERETSLLVHDFQTKNNKVGVKYSFYEIEGWDCPKENLIQDLRLPISLNKSQMRKQP